MGHNLVQVNPQIIKYFSTLFTRSIPTVNVTPLCPPTRSLAEFMSTVHDTKPATANGIYQYDPQVRRILPNSLYLTFNAPRVDDYHRALFLTYPPGLDSDEPSTNGTLFHATYIDSVWILERRYTKDISASSSLVLLYHIATIDPKIHKLDEQYHKINKVLGNVPLGKEAREREFGEKKQGNPVLGDYDCVIWTGDALRALSKEGLIDLGGRDADTIMEEARALAGPEDARTMVGKDFGGLTVVG